MPLRAGTGGAAPSLARRPRPDWREAPEAPGPGGEPRAALRPASAQDPAPANTLHAGPKTVCPLAADDGGLIGAFHGAAFDGKSLTLERFAYRSVKDHQRLRCCG